MSLKVDLKQIELYILHIEWNWIIGGGHWQVSKNATLLRESGRSLIARPYF